MFPVMFKIKQFVLQFRFKWFIDCMNMRVIFLFTQHEFDKKKLNQCEWKTFIVESVRFNLNHFTPL